jgi:hypothetical protein
LGADWGSNHEPFHRNHPASHFERLPLLKRIAARLVGFDGAYHRFTGKVTIEKFEGGVRTERFDDRAIWELMYLGKARPGAQRGDGGSPLYLS